MSPIIQIRSIASSLPVDEQTKAAATTSHSPTLSTSYSYCPIHQPVSFYIQNTLLLARTSQSKAKSSKTKTSTTLPKLQINSRHHHHHPTHNHYSSRLNNPSHYYGLEDPYAMNWPPPVGAHLLAPFDHQVAGQSSMLKYDECTVCKPLISREHFVYQTLPEGLREFTADYRGELEVGLAERDGYLQLYGLCVRDDYNDDVCKCSLQQSPADADFNDMDSSSIVIEKTKSLEQQNSARFSQSKIPGQSGQNGCVIRVLRSGSYEIGTSSTSTSENKPAESETTDRLAKLLKTPSLNPWSLKNHKKLLDKMRKGKHRHNSFRCILLENVVAGFKQPCILDLKIGSRLHGDDALPQKVETQSKKCAETTSNSLGARLCGMQVYQVDSGKNMNLDKYHGRLLTDKTFKLTLVKFIHNGVRYRLELLQHIICKLSRLIHCLQSVDTYRFYASSLLIMYDGLEDVPVVVKAVSNPETHRPHAIPAPLTSLPASSTLLSNPNPLKTVSTSSNNALSTDSHNSVSTLESSSKSHSNITQYEHTQTPLNEFLHTPLTLEANNGSSSNRVKNNYDENMLVADKSIRPKQNSNFVNCSHRSELSSSCTNVKQNDVINCVHTVDSSTNDSNDQIVPSSSSPSRDASSHSSLTQELLSSNLTNQSSTSNNSISKPPMNKDQDSRLSNSKAQDSSSYSSVVDVRMIDFAHTTHKGFPADVLRHTGPDMDYIQGLTNLVRLFEEIRTELLS